MKIEGIKEYGAIAAFVILATIAGGGCGGKPPEDMQMARVIDDEPATHVAATTEGETNATEAATAPAEPEVPAADMVTWNLDDLESAIDATGYSAWGEQTVIFNPASGTFTCPEGDYTKGKMSGVIDMELMIHESQLLIDHISEETYFHVEAHPEATFESESVKKTATGYEIVGGLTIKGKTVKLALPCTITEEDGLLTIVSKNNGVKGSWWNMKYKATKDDVLLNLELIFKKG